MDAKEVFIIPGWSSSKPGQCMGEFQDPLSICACHKADELRNLVLNIQHNPSDHISRISIQVCVDLETSVLTYDVSGCCNKLEADINLIINGLNHSDFSAVKIRLNNTYRISVEQFINGEIEKPL